MQRSAVGDWRGRRDQRERRRKQTLTEDLVDDDLPVDPIDTEHVFLELSTLTFFSRRV